MLQNNSPDGCDDPGWDKQKPGASKSIQVFHNREGAPVLGPSSTAFQNSFISRKLDQKQSIQDSNQCAHMGFQHRSQGLPQHSDSLTVTARQFLGSTQLCLYPKTFVLPPHSAGNARLPVSTYLTPQFLQDLEMSLVLHPTENLSRHSYGLSYPESLLCCFL